MSKISLLLFKDGADLRMDSFSCKLGLHTLSFGADGFTSHWILKLMFLFFNFQTCSLSVVEVLLCFDLKDDLCKLIFVLNSFSVSPIYVSWLFEVVSVTVALYTTHFVRHLPSSGQDSLVPEATVSYNSCKSFNFSISLLKKLKKEILLDWNLNLTLGWPCRGPSRSNSSQFSFCRYKF